MNLSAQQRPITELEAAREAAETLLNDHKGIVPDDLAARLSSFNDDLTVIIDDHYGVTDDEDDAQAEDDLGDEEPKDR